MWILNHDPESGNILKNDFNGKLSHMQKLTSGIKEAHYYQTRAVPTQGRAGSVPALTRPPPR